MTTAAAPTTRKSLTYIPDDLEFYAHQITGVRSLVKMGSHINADDMGLGKGGTLDTPVLTPSGWRRMGDLACGDLVIGANGRATSVTGVYPRGVMAVYRVTFSDGSSTDCTYDHLWNVITPTRKKRGSGYRTMELKQILSEGLRDAAGNCKHFIPMVEPVYFDDPGDCSLDPYLLGVLLGDGSLTHSPSLDTDYEIAESLVLPSDVSLNRSGNDWGYGGHYGLRGVLPYLRELGLHGHGALTKFIPHNYLWGSPQTRLAVLQGLLDTDGHPRPGDNNVEYSTSSKQLALDVQFIVQSLGGVARINEKATTHNTSYRMSVILPEGTVPFRSSRRLAVWHPRSKYQPTRAITSVEYLCDTEAICIRVDSPDHLYVTDDFIVTHNTLETLTVFAVDVERGWADSLLFVTLATLKENVADDIANLTLFRNVMILEGSPAKRKQQLLDFALMPKPRILIVNYEQVTAHWQDFNKLGFQSVAYDEAHNITNPRAKRTKACHKLTGDRHMILTGSPMKNNVDELWSLLYRIAPREFPSYYQFRNRYCNTPEAPIWMADGSFKEIGKIQVGDVVVGWSEEAGQRRRLMPSIVEAVQSRIAPKVVRATMASGRSVRCTPDHVWLNGNHGPSSTWCRVSTATGKPTGTLSHVVEPSPTLTPEQQREADWLGGIYDGEASRYFIAQSPTHNSAVYERICRALDVLGIPYSRAPMGVSIRGGRQSYVNLLNWTTITRREWLLEKAMGSQLNRRADRVESLLDEGPGEVVSMQTSTGNYVAWGYASRNCVFGGFKNKQIVGVKNEQELNRLLAKYMVRRLKTDVLDLPEKQIIPVRVPLHPEQQALYDEVMMNMELPRPDEAEPEAIENALTKFLRLKQICGTTATIEGYEDYSIKLSAAMNQITGEFEPNGYPVVIFTQFRGVLHAMERRLLEAGIDFRMLHGDIPRTDRVPTVRAWGQDNERGRYQVLLCMSQVAGVGLNMTAARHAIRLDKLWVPALNEQCEDRLYRIGADKTQPVQIFDYIARRTVESRVEAILRRKKRLFETIVEDADYKRKLYAALVSEDDDE